MTARARIVDEATRQARWSLAELGRELRNARLRRGLSQAAVAARLGMSSSQLSRVERGLAPKLSVLAAYRFGAAVGLRAYVRAYPGRRDVLDQPQLTLLDRLRGRVSRTWRWQLEATLPVEGDLHAVDALLSNGSCRIAVEAITRLADVQAQVRAAKLKARDIGATRVVLLIAATVANRRALRAPMPLLATAFPLGTRAILAALADGRDPGADGIVLL